LIQTIPYDERGIFERLDTYLLLEKEIMKEKGGGRRKVGAKEEEIVKLGYSKLRRNRPATSPTRVFCV
jgi:hypothetical protein